MANYRYLGYGITNEQGVATLDHDANGDPITHSYTGTGAGEIDIIASLDDSSHISDSSLQSVTYDVLDCMFYDNGIDGSLNSEWWTSSLSQLSVIEDNTGITASTTSSNTYYLSPNKKGTPKSQMSDLVEWNDVICEFTYLTHTGNPQFMLRDGTSQHRMVYFTDFNEGDVLKIKYTENTVTAWKNDAPISLIGGSLNGECMMRFNISQGSVKFKDFKIYPI